MAFERIFEEPQLGGKITIKSDGWSGDMIGVGDQFQFDIHATVSTTYDGELNTQSDSYGVAQYSGGNYDPIFGISLEHFGTVYNASGDPILQTLGRVTVPGSVEQIVPAWGVSRVGVQTLSVDWDDWYIKVHHYVYTDPDTGYEHTVYGDEEIREINMGNLFYLFLQSRISNMKVELTTDLPIFATDADFAAWVEDPTNPETLALMLNREGVDPKEQYILDQKYYYLHNIFEHNYHGTKSSAWYNYRWKPGYDNKIRLYRVTPTDSRYYTMVLTVPSGLTRFKGPKGEYNDDDAFEVDEDDLQTHFQEYSYTISRVAPRDEVTVTDFDTNIPIWGSAEDATKYANDELSIEDALNYADILAYEQQLPEPDFGDIDIETETGVNGQTYAAGSAIYVLTRQEMIKFFTEIFKIQDPSFINAFKDGNLLFGDNQANAIIGCQYFPFDASLVCSLESSSGSIWVGGWESQNATGKKVNFNDKVITIGEFFLPDMFKDVRDYEPYTNIYVQLPYCGTYQLSVQKYINKTVKICYAVDIFTGACSALIYANNILMDSMDGMIGSQRPVTGRTAANMLQAITKGSASVAAGAAGGIKAAGIAGELAGTAGAIGGALPAFGANVGGGAMFGAAHVAAGGAALGAVGAGALGVGAAGVAAVAGVDMMYKAKNAYADPPMATRGQYGGSLGMFANQKVHFIVAIRHNYRPENELDVIGYPSGRSGKIGQFSGFLKSSCVYLADGFIGSVQERNEILEMIAKGIYI